jgi:uncharacterized protein (TIGR02421 family)
MNKFDERLIDLDNELVSIIKDFFLLPTLTWSKETMQDFLRNQEKGNTILPKVTYNKIDNSDTLKKLSSFLNKLGKENSPAINFLRETAQSYIYSGSIIKGVGTDDVSKFSKKLYGSPKDKISGYKRRNVDIARYLLRVVREYQNVLTEEPMIYSAEELAKLLLQRIATCIPAEKSPIAVTVDDQITARATAGPNYVKIRKGASFSQNDLDQLFHHEVMIHTLTYINGRSQPFLKTLGYNSPRTTATQEGLAVFAEYISLSIELVRMKRIALRIIAIDKAERGADFIDLFRYFIENGQNNEESYYSAMRIFRGGKPEGGIVFYKDNVYLKGLIEVGSFLKHAMHKGFVHDIALLFCGKLTTNDVLLLKPLYKSGHIVDPAYMPSWAKNSSELATHLALNDLAERFGMRRAFFF